MGLSREQEAEAERLAAELSLPLSVAQEVVATGSGSPGCLPTDEA